MSEQAEALLYWKNEADNADNGFDKAFCEEQARCYARAILDPREGDWCDFYS